MTIEHENAFRSAVTELCQNLVPINELPAIMDRILAGEPGPLIEVRPANPRMPVLEDWALTTRQRETNFRQAIQALVRDGYDEETLHSLLQKTIQDWVEWDLRT